MIRMSINAIKLSVHAAALIALAMGTVGVVGPVRADEPSPKRRVADSPDVLRVASVAMHSRMGEPGENLDHVVAWLHKAHEAGAALALFPELCVTGSLCKEPGLTTADAERIVDQAARLTLARLEPVCRELKMAAIVGTTERFGQRFRNAALVIGPSGYVATFHKLWLPNSTEIAAFEPGEVLPVFSWGTWRFSVGICADLDRGEYFRAAARGGADLFLLAVGGSGGEDLVSPGGDQSRQAQYHRGLHLKLMQDWAKQNALYVFYANQAGRSGANWFPGLALAVDPSGKLLGEHLPDEGMIVTEVSHATLAAARRQRPDDPSNTTGKPFDLKNSAGHSIEVRVVKFPEPN